MLVKNHTFVESALIHPSPVHITLLIVLAVLLASFLLLAVCVLCNVGGTLDCIYAARRRHRSSAQTAAALQAVDNESQQPLLPVAQPVRQAASASATAASPTRAQAPSRGSTAIPSRSGGGKYQNSRPFGDFTLTRTLH